MSNTIAWYNPEKDVIVLQDFDSGKELIMDYEWEENITEVLIYNMMRRVSQQQEFMMLYGSKYNPLEHGLWVRLGEV